MKFILGLFVIFIIAVIYFLPTVIALNRKYKNRVSVFIVNLFLGWTLVGWVVALALSFINDIDETKRPSDKFIKFLGYASFSLFVIVGLKYYQKKLYIYRYEQRILNSSRPQSERHDLQKKLRETIQQAVQEVQKKHIKETTSNSDSFQSPNSAETENPAKLLFQPDKLEKMKSNELKEVFSKISASDVDIALAEGGNVNARTRYFTVLSFASEYCNDPEIIETLIKHGAEINYANKNGETALMSASQYNENPEIIETLIINGADINAKSEYWGNALGYACRGNKNPEVIKMLIAKGSNINEWQKGHNIFTRETALDYAVAYNDNPQITEILLKNGAIIDRYQVEKIIRHTKHPEVIPMLTKYSIDIKKVNNNGDTLLMEASRWNKNPEIIKSLIDNGLSVISTNKEGETALMLAVNNDNPKILTTLLASGAKVNDKDKNGKTALMYACELVKDINVIEKLLENGADVNAKDKKGNTVYDYALKNKNILSSKIKAALNKYNKKDTDE